VRYMLMLCGEDSSAEVAPDDAFMVACKAWNEQMQRRGVLRGVEGLRPPDEARTVRVRAHQVLLSDGPFAETKEQIGGYCLVECANEDEAVELASKHPWARIGMIEVRPLWHS
jgi:hypothetical protein